MYISLSVLVLFRKETATNIETDSLSLSVILFMQSASFHAYICFACICMLVKV